MSKEATLSCPVCGTELTPAQLFAHEAAQHAFEQMVALSVPIGARVLAYVTMFAPPVTRLTVPKQVKLVLQLLPDLQRQAITHKGRDWRVPLQLWEAGIAQLEAARAAGKLALPLSGHGYLYTVLAALAEKQGAAAPEVASAPPSPLANRDDRDPALKKLDEDNARASAMPEAVRKRLAAFKREQA